MTFRKHFSLFLFFTLFTSFSAISSDNPLWLRYPSISPDGNSVAFCYKGDIYKVSTEGGVATPITSHVAYDFKPVWSGDGNKIAYASDRFGNFDIYLTDKNGGKPERITYHSNNEIPNSFTPDDKSVLYSASILDKASNAMFPSSVLSELYEVSLSNKNIQQVLTTPAEEAKMTSDGSFIYYQDRKGYEDKWRKHHKSSVTRDLWVYDTKSGKHQKITSFKGEDRWPVIDQSEKNIYFLTERFNNNFNIGKFKINEHGKNFGKIKQITSLENHPVRFLSVSNDNIICYSYNGEVYIKKPNENPKKLSVEIHTDNRQNTIQYKTFNSRVSEMDLSPNGKEIAFIIRGDVFTTTSDYKTTKRITNSPEQERSVSFSPDGKKLLYASERNGSWNLYETSLSREDEKLFTLSTVLKEKPILVTTKETFQPQYSPDGKEVAFLEERTTLKVLNLKSGDIRTILEGKYNYSYSDGDQWFQWSPDGKWFLAQYSPQHFFSNEIGLIDAKGKKEVRNLTKSGYEDNMSKWMMDGKMMIWFTDRKGMRSHGSWGAQYDVYGMFFNQEAYDTFNMTKEELEVYKKDKYGKKENDEDRDEEKEKKKIEPVKIEFKGLNDRTKRLTIHSSSLSDAVMSKKGDKLYYLCKFDKYYDLWVHDFLDNETKKVVDLKTKYGGQLHLNKKGNELFVLSGGKISKVELKKNITKPVPFSAKIELKTDEEKEYLFEHIWRQVKKKFYDKDLHGVDWEFYKKEYKRFLPHINNNYDFAEMLSEMLGELNASHTGARYYSSSENEDQTASLGIFFDWNFEGKGIKITEIMDKSPLNKAESNIQKGHIIEKINNNPVENTNEFFRLLNHQEGKKLLITVFDPNKNKRWNETIKPISQREKGSMLYDRWVEKMRDKTNEISDGKIGYIHIKSMNDRSFRQIYSNLFGKNYHKEAVVIDTRFNGGGWLHNDLAILFNGTKYVDYYPRGQHFGHDPMTQWTKESVVLMSEGNYSDAHGFPYAYKTLNIGKTVGMPVPGTMTAVWWERLQDPSLVFGIPQVGSKNMEGEYLENKQLEPDVKIKQEYSKVSKGIDQQLIKAIEILMN